MESRAKANDPSVRIRFPKAVLKKVDGAARESGRSRNSEIVWRLAESFRPPEAPAAAALSAESPK